MLQYLIKWLGYPDSDNTWEPAHQIHAPEMIKAYHQQTPLSAIKTLTATGERRCPTPPSKPSVPPSNSLSETSSNTLTPQLPWTPPLSTPPNLGTTPPKRPSTNPLIAYALQKGLTKTTTYSTVASAKTSTAPYTTRTCPITPSRWRPSPLLAPQNLSTFDPFPNDPSPCPSRPSQHWSPSPWPTATKKPSKTSPKASSPPSRSTPKKSARPTMPKTPASTNWSKHWEASSPSSLHQMATSVTYPPTPASGTRQ
jgi:hypothetical protein